MDKSVPLHKALNVFSRASEGVFCQREEVWFPTRSWPWCGHSHLFVHSQDTLRNAVHRRAQRPSYISVFSLLGVVPDRCNMGGFSAHKNTKSDKCRWHLRNILGWKRISILADTRSRLKALRKGKIWVSRNILPKTKSCAFCWLVSRILTRVTIHGPTGAPTVSLVLCSGPCPSFYFHHCKYCVSHPVTAHAASCRLPASNVRIRWQKRKEEREIYFLYRRCGLLGCCAL